MNLKRFAIDFSTNYPQNGAMTDLLVGFAAAILAIGAWKAYGTASEWIRSVERRLTALAEAAAAAGPRATFAQDSVLRTLKGVDKLGGIERLGDFLDRLAAMEKRIAEIDLTVLDTAEKVAARLSDRERKRTKQAVAAEEVELDDDAAWWARARAAHPLPGMPVDPAQLPLMAMTEEEQ